MPNHTASTAPSKALISMGYIVCIFGVIYGLILHMDLWTLGSDGFSIVSHTSPYWDFNNLWTGGRLALENNTDALFNMESYRAHMDRLLAQNVPDQEWSYPPNMLLIGTPLALLPVFWAYWLWTLGTIAALHFALRPFKLRPLIHIAVLLSPAVFLNALFGQNGALLAALLLGGLVLAPQRPIIAGILIGLMTIKPHLGILIPFCFIASRNWTAFASAAITSALLFLVTALPFGFDVWSQFLQHTQPMMSDIMHGTFPQSYHGNAVTVFVFCRMLGGNLLAAYGLQAVFSLACIASVIWLWRPTAPIQHIDRVALTCVLALLATPYGYTYDMIGLSAAIAIICSRHAPITLTPLLILVWTFPFYNHLLFAQHKLTLGAIILLATALLLYRTTKTTAPQLA
ncbi:MAG: hypothetical protein COB36_12450 [Alphaproteobacteria bacterium]|nr:MAG: hypothetical protein COB36_12450 [Alphaproteobacteria bacterium]